MANQRTILEKIIAHPGGARLLQNLRASGATDLIRSLLSHTAVKICGHTEQIAQENCWTVLKSDLDQAIADLFPRYSG